MFDLKPVPVPDLSGKTVLVTGAGRGIGAALVARLAGAGARVYAGIHRGREPSDVWDTDTVVCVPLDVTDRDSVVRAVSEVRSGAGRLDALVNNAGVIAPIGPLPSLSAEDLTRAFEVNAFGMFRMTLAALDLLRSAAGVVVNAGTGAATTPMEGWAGYCSSKAAARMLSLMMSKELGDTGIRVFFLGIPPTDTAMQSEIRASRLNPISQIPQSDLVHPDVPASALAWLCSDRARSVTIDLLDVRDDMFRALSSSLPRG